MSVSICSLARHGWVSISYRSCPVPIERRTRAPAPSGVSIASNTLAMLRGVTVVALNEGSFGGMTGRPTKVELAAGDMVVFVRACEMFKTVLAIAVVFVFDDKAEEMYGIRFCRW